MRVARDALLVAWGAFAFLGGAACSDGTSTSNDADGSVDDSAADVPQDETSGDARSDSRSDDSFVDDAGDASDTSSSTDADADALDAPVDVAPETCVPDACASGACRADGACAECKGDGDCGGGDKCCAGACVDVRSDDDNCGACGTSCGLRARCASSACTALTLSGACTMSSATIADDGLIDDTNAGVTFGLALAGCVAPPSTRTISQDAPGVLEAATGRPILGPTDLYVAAGGPFGQKAVAYLQSARSPLVYFADLSSVTWTERATGKVLVSVALTDVTSSHDWFAIETMTEPVSSTFVLAAFGGLGPGTTAAAWYFRNSVLPSSTLSAKGWTLVEWIDGNGNTVPDATDTFNVVASGG